MDIWKLLPGPVNTIGYPGWYRSAKRILRRKVRGKNGAVAFLLATGMEVAWFYLTCGVKHRIGYDFWGRGWLLTAKLRSDGTPTSDRLTSEHHACNMLRLLELVGVDRAHDTQNSRLPFGRRNGSAAIPLRIGVVVSGNTSDKQFSPEFWSSVVATLGKKFPVGCIELFGSESHTGLGAEICRRHSNCRNLCGTTSVGDLIEKLPRCTLIISPDTGTAHLAARLGVPTIVIFTSGCPVWTIPRGTSIAVIRPDLPCSPCFGAVTCSIDHACTRAVSPGRVAAAASGLLSLDADRISFHNRRLDAESVSSLAVTGKARNAF
ncbi:glycosyltransferase family 9 protein [Pseudomonadota bacterium]